MKIKSFLKIGAMNHSMKTENSKLKIALRKPLALTLVVLITLATLLTLTSNHPQVAQAAWYSQDWNYRQKIIIDHNKVPNTDQTDFPVLIKITDTNNPIFSSKVQDDGDDIRFTSTDQTTILNHEIESYSKTNHELWAWVKVPTLSHETDTTIYLYYGNQSAEAPTTASKQAVWSNGYAGVWHLGELSGDFADSTENMYSGADTVSATNKTGKIGWGQEFDGVDDYIGTSAAIAADGRFNVSGWFYLENYAPDAPGWWQGRVIVDSLGPSNPDLHYLEIYGLGSGKYSAGFNWDGGIAPENRGSINSGNTASLGSWHYLSSSYDQNNFRLYIDGQEDIASPLARTFAAQQTSIFNIGKFASPSLYGNWDGFLDEVRASSSARSADWVATEYANQNSPETFFQIRSEVSQVTAPLQAGPTGWYDLSWGSRQPISLNNTHDKVPNTNQTDFPVLVKITDQNNELFTKAQSDGDDILFTSSDGTTKLAHEIEKYDATAHELWAWVKVPTLLTGTNTNIYMYYGNSSAVSQQSKTAVWSNGYAVVYHMNDNIGNTAIVDSRGIVNGVSQQNTDILTTNGKTSTAVNFNGSTDYINIASLPAMVSGGTICAWSNLAVAGNNPGISSYTTGGRYWELRYAATTRVPILLWNYGSPGPALSTKAVGLGEWHRICGKASGGTITLFVDGVQMAQTVGGVYAAPTALDIGRRYGGTLPLQGSIDEFVISGIDRSADWIATEYNNQNSPETFMSFGTTETADSFAPTNPTTINSLNAPGGGALGNAGTDSTPYYSWPEPEVSGGASDVGVDKPYVSGVAGYYSYFGTSCGSGGADPATTRGVLADTGGGIHYSSDTNVSVPDLTTNEEAYCLRLKTKDIAGNVSATTEVATYNYDLTNPLPPTFISVNPAGYSSVNSFDFTWPAGQDVGSEASGVGSYQYKRGEGSNDDWSQIQTAKSANDILKYQDGANIFLVRSIDNAGNISSEVQTTYYFSANPPTEPTGLTVTPTISDVNSFSFSWTAPQNDIGIMDYGYSINASPTIENITWTNSTATSLSAAPYATLQGVNTLYLVAKDSSGAYSFEPASVAEVQFNCTTPVPPMPVSVSIADSSKRDIGRWALTLKWSPGVNQDQNSFDHYSIERSLDNLTFSQIAVTKSLAYIDSNGLNNTGTYYYRIKALDNAGSTSAASGVVSKTPTGKYDTPPTIVTSVESIAKASGAKISWTVDRPSTSSVRFGTAENDLKRVQINSTEETSHSVNLSGLTPGTTYYFEVQSLDNFRDYTSESAFSSTYSFTTLPAPSIKDLTVRSITINSAEVTFETSTASAVTLNYGKTISYGSILENKSATTLHTTKLTDLEAGTTYHLKITGTDIDGNSLVSDDYVFDTLPMPEISDLTVQPDYQGPNPGIKINWKTNVPTSSSVEYVPKQGTIAEEQSKSALVTEHEILLQQLADSTSYRFYAYGTDQFGNTARSDQNTLDTPLDSRPPKISDLSIESQSIGANQDAKAQIIVSWKTDEPATSQVEYGQGVSGSTYASKTQKDASLSLSHTVIIGNLDPSKTYHLRAVSEDKASNPTSSEDNAVITKKAQDSAFNIIVSALSKAFGWLRIFK